MGYPLMPKTVSSLVQAKLHLPYLIHILSVSRVQVLPHLRIRGSLVQTNWALERLPIQVLGLDVDLEKNQIFLETLTLFSKVYLTTLIILELSF